MDSKESILIHLSQFHYNIVPSEHVLIRKMLISDTQNVDIAGMAHLQQYKVRGLALDPAIYRFRRVECASSQTIRASTINTVQQRHNLLYVLF